MLKKVTRMKIDLKEMIKMKFERQNQKLDKMCLRRRDKDWSQENGSLVKDNKIGAKPRCDGSNGKAKDSGLKGHGFNPHQDKKNDLVFEWFLWSL